MKGNLERLHTIQLQPHDILKRQNYGESGKEWLPGIVGGGWRAKDEAWDFEGSEPPLSDTVMVGACHTFVQIQKIGNTKNGP